MIIFRWNNSWLRHRVNAHIREHHKNLFDTRLKRTLNAFESYVSDKRQWWIILLFVICMFVFSSLFSDWEFLNFINLKDETSRILVDQRTTNIATIISITLVVVGFLINNLAVKSPHTYKLLFRKSYLYPTIYLTLSTISCFIVVSTLRDTKIAGFDFSRAVLAGTYLVFIILFLIGFLFRTIIQFTNEKEISEMLHNQFMNEAKENMKGSLMRKYSSELFTTAVQEAGAKEYTIAEAWNFSNINYTARSVSQKDIGRFEVQMQLIKDINTDRIKSFIFKKKKRNKGTIFYRKLGLDMASYELKDFVWAKEKSNSWFDRFMLKRCLVIRNLPLKEKETDVYRKYFDDKLEKLSSESNYKNLESILQSYIEIYTLQMQNQK